MTRRLLAAAALALSIFSLSSCKEEAAGLIPVYGWTGINSKMSDDDLRAKFQDYKDHGLDGVCANAGMDRETIARASAIAHEVGLEYHAWVPCMPQGGKPHEWYAVNRLDQSADEYPAFVDHYKFLDPRNPRDRREDRSLR